MSLVPGGAASWVVLPGVPSPSLGAIDRQVT